MSFSHFIDVRTVSVEITCAVLCHFDVVASAVTIHTSWTSQNVDDRFGGALKPNIHKKTPVSESGIGSFPASLLCILTMTTMTIGAFSAKYITTNTISVQAE